MPNYEVKEIRLIYFSEGGRRIGFCTYPTKEMGFREGAHDVELLLILTAMAAPILSIPQMCVAIVHQFPVVIEDHRKRSFSLDVRGSGLPLLPLLFAFGRKIREVRLLLGSLQLGLPLIQHFPRSVEWPAVVSGHFFGVTGRGLFFGN